jgi:putative acetyltransferase
MESTDAAALLTLWERSVRATHDFLDEADIVFYRPLVPTILSSGTLELWVLTSRDDSPIGFLGLAPNGIEALFLEPAYHGQGYGRLLVAHAQECLGGAVVVDVNEENVAGRKFYEALGFVLVGRSPLDDTGRPHPLLRLRREAPRTERAG